MHNDAPRFDPFSGEQLPKYVTYNKEGPTHRRENPYRMRFPWKLVRALGGTRAMDKAYPTLDALIASNEYRTLCAHVAEEEAKASKRANQHMQAPKKRRGGGIRSEVAKRRSEDEYGVLRTRGMKFHPDIVWQPKNKSWLVSRNFGTGWRWRGTAYSYADALLLHKGCINLRSFADVIGNHPNAPRKRKFHARELLRRLHREGLAGGSVPEPVWEDVPEVCTSVLEPCDDDVDEEDEDDGVEEESDGVEEESEEEDVVLQGTVVEEGEGEGEEVIVEADDEGFWSATTAATTTAAAFNLPSSSGRVSKPIVRYDGVSEDRQRSHNIQNCKKHTYGSYTTAGIYFVHMKLKGVHAPVRKARAKFAPLAFHSGSLLDETWGRSA